jgi:ABC-2 type transport system ATP-binding protein
MNTMELKHLHKSFGKVKAVDDVSLVIPSGEIFGLIGRNGAGKTTTIRMIMDIFKPDSGEIVFQGEPHNASFRDRVGYLPEERGLYGKMGVLDTLLFFAEIKSMREDVARPKAMHYLNRFGLAERINDKVETLSKGNQQKVQFIAAILHDPQLIILDEPFSGLDPVNTTLMINMINELREQGLAILFSTHIMDFAEKLCDHIALIDNGQIILEGSVSEIKQQHDQSAVNVVSDGDLTFLAELPYVTATEADGEAYSISVDNRDSVQRLLGDLVSRGVTVKKFDAMPVTLHDIFVIHAGHGEETPGEGL